MSELDTNRVRVSSTIYDTLMHDGLEIVYDPAAMDAMADALGAPGPRAGEPVDVMSPADIRWGRASPGGEHAIPQRYPTTSYVHPQDFQNRRAETVVPDYKAFVVTVPGGIDLAHELHDATAQRLWGGKINTREGRAWGGALSVLTVELGEAALSHAHALDGTRIPVMVAAAVGGACAILYGCRVPERPSIEDLDSPLVLRQRDSEY